MTINERLFKIMKIKKITQESLAKILNTTQPAIGNWKKRGTNPSIEDLPKICELLDISIEYLITGQETEKHYSKDEQRILQQYRDAPPKAKEQIRDYINLISNAYKRENNEPETISKIG